MSEIRQALEASRAETREARLVVDANYREIDRLKAEVSAGILASQANACDARAAEDEAERLRGKLALANADAMSMAAIIDLERGHCAAARLRAETAEAVFGMDQPWPLVDVLDKLAYAARHLLNGHGYDAKGWEQLDAAIMAGIGYTAQARAFLAGRGGSPTVVPPPAPGVPPEKEPTR